MSSYSLWLLNLHGKRTILITKHDEDKKKKTCVATQNTVINAVIAYYISWETRIQDCFSAWLCVLWWWKWHDMPENRGVVLALNWRLLDPLQCDQTVQQIVSFQRAWVMNKLWAEMCISSLEVSLTPAHILLKASIEGCYSFVAVASMHIVQ